MFKNEYEIDVIRIINAIIKKWKFIAILMILFTLIGAGLSANIGDDKYSATATAYAAAEDSYSESTNAVTAMNAYLDVAKSYKVCQRAVLIMGRGDIEATDIQGAVSVGTSAKTTSRTSAISSFMNSSATIVYFTATTTDPELSMEMANAMAQSYTIEMEDILHTDSVKMLDTAYKYTKSYNAKKEAVKDIIKFTLYGFAISCMVIVLCEIFDKRVRTIREATIRNNLPVIGVIPDFKE